MEPFTPTVVQEQLNSLGINSGDMVFVHTVLNQFGFSKNKNGQFQLALAPEVLLKALKKTIGKQGTIVVPAFTLNESSPDFFSVSESVSHTGSFIEHLRKETNCYRSIHPLFSMVAIGSKARIITEEVDASGYGENSPYRHLKEHNAKLLLVGAPYCSFKDYVELQCKVPYRYKKFFHSTIQTKTETYTATFEHDVKYFSPKVVTMNFYDALTEKEKKILNEVQLGGATIRCIDAQRAYTILEKKFDTNPLYLLKETPDHLEALLKIHKITHPPKEKEEMSLRLFAFQDDHCEKWAWVLVSLRNWEPRILTKIEQLGGQSELPLWVQNKINPSECAIIVGNTKKNGAETSIEVLSQFLEKKHLNTLKEEFVFELLNHETSSVVINIIR